MSAKKSFVHPPELKYTEEHEWVRAEGDEVVVGITDYAQDQLGDVVFVELPAVGDQVQQFKPFGVVESVKAASDLFSPVSGEVVATNEALLTQPELVNTSPYEEAWMIRVRLSDKSEVAKLLDVAAYEALLH